MIDSTTASPSRAPVSTVSASPRHSAPGTFTLTSRPSRTNGVTTGAARESRTTVSVSPLWRIAKRSPKAGAGARGTVGGVASLATHVPVRSGACRIAG